MAKDTPFSVYCPAMYRRRTDDYDMTRRPRRRERRPRMSAGMIVVLAVILGVGGYVLTEVGRALFYFQGLQEFLSTMPEQPPASVKEQLEKYAAGLSDHNPLVRNASVAAMRAVTGLNLGADAAAWGAWWRTNRESWVYQPPAKP